MTEAPRRLGKAALEFIAARELKRYENGLYLFGSPCAIPIEEMIEQQYGISIEYHNLRHDMRVLGQMIFEDCFAPIYDADAMEYTVIDVQAGTMLIDIRLLQPRYSNRLRFTQAHELAHFLIHKEMFRGIGAYEAAL